MYLQGASQTSYDGELVAPLKALRAAAEVGIDLVLIIDNRSVLDKLQQMRMKQFHLPRDRFEQWVDISKDAIGRRHLFHWIPSHGKKADAWEVPTEIYGSEQKWRWLNARADAAADEGAKMAKHILNIALRERRAQTAERLAERWVRWQMIGAGMWMKSIPELEARDGWMFAIHEPGRRSNAF